MTSEIYYVPDLKDCIHYGIDSDTGMRCCNKKKTLYRSGESMCHLCRLWDGYIPSDASVSEKQKALDWQDMGYGEQSPYEEYFD